MGEHGKIKEGQGGLQEHSGRRMRSRREKQPLDQSDDTSLSLEATRSFGGFEDSAKVPVSGKETTPTAPIRTH